MNFNLRERTISLTLGQWGGKEGLKGGETFEWNNITQIESSQYFHMNFDGKYSAALPSPSSVHNSVSLVLW